jgi:hypothetical protein
LTWVIRLYFWYDAPYTVANLSGRAFFLNRLADIFILLKKSILVPFTTLKILYIRKSGIDIEGPDEDAITAYNEAPEDGSKESPSNSLGHLNITHSTASLDSFVMYKMSRLPPKLREFATWAFGPDGLPTLEVLAFSDFSYDGRFEFRNKLFCRHTRSIRNLENDTSQQLEDELIRIFRLIRRNDRELWDLIDRNKEFLEACPINSIIND